MANILQKVHGFIMMQGGPVTSKKIEKECGLNGQGVRNVVNALRQKGYPIGSSNLGYFICYNERDFNQTISGLKSRVTSMNEAIHGLEAARDKAFGGARC